MTDLAALLQSHVDAGRVPGAVALVGGADPEVAVVGHHDLERRTPMARDSLFRIASVTKLVVAAALLRAVEEGRCALGDPVARWLPELAAPVVVRTPDAAVDDVVPVRRAITVEDLLTSRTGWGLASDFALPAVGLLVERIERDGEDHDPRAPEQWLSDLATVPLLHQPGEQFLYNTSSQLQGALLARLHDRPLPEVLVEVVTGPLGMVDTGFAVPETDLPRLTTAYHAQDGVLRPTDTPADTVWTRVPAFPAGAGGLVSTLDDLHRFCRMLLAGGTLDGTRVLAEATVAAMRTDQLAPGQGTAGAMFLDGQGWGYGGGVDTHADPAQPWVVPGRYGWVGGSGTAAYVVPSTGSVAVLLTQRALGGPDDFAVIGDFCTYAAGR